MTYKVSIVSLTCLCISYLTLQDLPKPIRANFILNVETDELFITAGLQDRVVQVSKEINSPQMYRHNIEPCHLT